MSAFDEEPDAPLHGECAAEISRLQAEIKLLHETIAKLGAPAYWWDEKESYDSVHDYMDNAQPDAGETFELTPYKSFPVCTFRCIKNGDSFDYEQVTSEAKS